MFQPSGSLPTPCEKVGPKYSHPGTGVSRREPPPLGPRVSAPRDGVYLTGERLNRGHRTQSELQMSTGLDVHATVRVNSDKSTSEVPLPFPLECGHWHSCRGRLGSHGE